MSPGNPVSPTLLTNVTGPQRHLHENVLITETLCPAQNLCPEFRVPSEELQEDTRATTALWVGKATFSGNCKGRLIAWWHQQQGCFHTRGPSPHTLQSTSSETKLEVKLLPRNWGHQGTKQYGTGCQVCLQVPISIPDPRMNPTRVQTAPPIMGMVAPYSPWHGFWVYPACLTAPISRSVKHRNTRVPLRPWVF